MKPLSLALQGIKIPQSGIDLLSVDVEGLDYEVLTSFDWGVHLPKIIIAESNHSDMRDIIADPIHILLSEKGYSLYAKTGHSLIFCLIS
jgi:hypothetical protein